MKTRRVYTIGNHIDPSIAQYVGKHFYPNTQIEVADIESHDALHGLTATEYETLVFIGNSDGERYGTYTAKEFALHLVFALGLNNELMEKVKHFYFIGCNMGIVKKDHSLAQEFTNELYLQGFHKAQVHSIVAPEGAEGHVMCIEVIRHLDLTDYHIGKHQFGYLNAFLISQNKREQYEEIQKMDRGRQELEIKFKDQHAYPFLNAVNPFMVLSLPQNTLFPNESVSQRKYRIIQHQDTHLFKEQQIAIDCLLSRRRYELQKGEEKYAFKINYVVHELKKSEPKDWQRVLKNNKYILKNSIFGITINRNSNTLALVDALCEGRIEEARQMVKVFEGKNELRHLQTQKHGFFSTQKRSGDHFEKTTSNEEPTNHLRH